MKSAFFAVPLLCGSFLYAQGPGWHGNASGTPPTPAQIAQNATNRLTRFFSLTSTQQSEVLAILTGSETQIVALRTQIQPLQTTLTTAIKANNSGQINATLQQISPLEEQIQAAQAGAAGQIYATVLTSTQQAQLTNGLGPLMGGPMGGMGGGMGGGGGFRGHP